MLIEFTVGNFKSFRDRTTFSMIAANLTSDDPALDRDNVVPMKKDLRLLKSAAVYGANASGKSNLGLALKFMRQFVLDSAREASNPAEGGLEPFLLHLESREQPSFFEMIFLTGGRQYRYGFEADRSHVVSEWLFHVPKTKEVALFVREGQEIDVRTGLKEGRGLETRTRPAALFLSVTALFNSPLGQELQLWFGNLVVTTGLQDDQHQAFTLRCLQVPNQKKDILALVKALDLGIEDLVALKPTIEDLPHDMPENAKKQMVATFAERIYAVHYVMGPENRLKPVEIFDLDLQESQGTRKLIALAGPLHSILAHGQVMFVDELDARLHPLMTRRIIEMFHSPLTNPKGAQLIFATHDTNLLDKSLFRRDQIWFAEKDQQGATHLASLSEYRVRNDAAFEKNYLEGRYGAIPFLGDLTRLPWAQEQGAAEEAEREPALA